ncbi:MAG: methionyl-tRNA formyltransferase [Bacteroidetes bacterium]|nr:MAG: methionyl-tRNA formyltransferase [Bacteroidota bacterium]
MRIVFMGTPEFAVPSLRILHQAGYDIAAVVTAADKPAGRGRKLRPSAVKSYATAHHIPVLQPLKLRKPDFLHALQGLQADLFVVVAFRMLPQQVWSMPRLGTFNLHASLLPDYRGAAPINWVIINGESRTGLTTFLIDKHIDTGNILLQTPIDIPFHWTAGDLHDHLMEEGARLVLQTARGLEAGTLTPKPQDERLFIHKAPKIFKEDCHINWQAPALRVYNFIRGLSPYPTAWTTLNGQVLKLFRATMVEGNKLLPAGSLRRGPEGESLLVACQDAWLQIEELQLEGKKRMPTSHFLRGYKGPLQQLGGPEHEQN